MEFFFRWKLKKILKQVGIKIVPKPMSDTAYDIHNGRLTSTTLPIIGKSLIEHGFVLQPQSHDEDIYVSRCYKVILNHELQYIVVIDQ